MDSDTLFFVAIAGYYVLRKVLSAQKKAKSRQPQGDAPPSSLPQVPQPTPVPAPRKSQPQFGDALNEIRAALGMQEYGQEKPAYEPEPFAPWDEDFERRGSVAAESRDRWPEQNVRSFSDDKFRKHTPNRESNFHDNWSKEESDFGFRAPSKHDHEADRQEAAPSPYATTYRAVRRHEGLVGAKNLRETIILSEILGQPLSRRIQSARRRLS